MASNGKQGRSIFFYGCVGCLGCLGLIILIVGLTFVTAYMGAGELPEEPRVVTRALPEPTPPPPTLSPESLAADMPGASGEILVPGAGRVHLDLAQAEFRIEPGEPGTPLRVEGRFNESRYTLEEVLEPGEEGEPWVYRVSFRRNTRGGFLTWLGETLTGTSPRVTVYLPPDIPFALALAARQGEAVVDLGGLWLTEADLDLSMGGVDLDVSRPLRAPLESFTLNGGMGGGSFRRLGNASPRRLEVEFSMGGMHLDLTGAWLRDAEISIEHSMGGGAVRLPRNAIIEGVPSHRSRTMQDPERPLPVLRFEVSSDMGNVEFFD